MTGTPLLIQSGSYLASEDGIDISGKLSGKGFLSGEGFSMLEATGSGKVLVSSYGAIYEKELGSGEKYIVDTTHLVAFDGNVNVQARAVGGLKSTVLSGEGTVVELTGPGSFTCKLARRRRSSVGSSSRFQQKLFHQKNRSQRVSWIISPLTLCHSFR
jgi:uncharacterized protein (AIM24 family)